MRIGPFLLIAAIGVLTGCGGPETSQANNSQANIGNDASPPATANASTVNNGMVMLAVPKEKLLQVMHERHEGMEAIGKANKAIRRALDASPPDVASVRAPAAQIASLSQKASRWFPQGTGPELGKTGAKPEIWQSRQDFAGKLHNFQVAAKAFNAAAASGNAAAVKARYADLGQTCKACHDKYRMDMHH
jgi:cytochrome c556